MVGEEVQGKQEDRSEQAEKKKEYLLEVQVNRPGRKEQDSTRISE